MHVAASEGSVVIRTSINGYRVDVQATQKSLPSLSISLMLQLIFPPQISPAKLNIFSHHSVTVSEYTMYFLTRRLSFY